FAFFHYPLNSGSKSESSDTYLQGPNELEGLLGSNGVKLAFNGHAHMYVRSKPNSNSMVTYLAGGGGASLESIREGYPFHFGGATGTGEHFPRNFIYIHRLLSRLPIS